jgi:hypothetical protein
LGKPGKSSFHRKGRGRLRCFIMIGCFYPRSSAKSAAHAPGFPLRPLRTEFTLSGAEGR